MRSVARIDYESELVVGLIPARWGSTRFEGKPLVDISGIPMIKRVYDRACMSKELDTVVVLTDDSRISNYCSKHEMRCIVIEDECSTGTDRCSKALSLLDGDIFVNIQGDEPLINPEAIDKMITDFDDETDIVNAYVRVDQEYKLTDPNVVKVVMDKDNHALYYSRLPISRYQQLGLYAYKRGMLDVFPHMDRHENEIEENDEIPFEIKLNIKDIDA